MVTDTNGSHCRFAERQWLPFVSVVGSGALAAPSLTGLPADGHTLWT